ncbi:MAG: hypothetical protein MI922_21700 [Bacteroidales bacterium]|nr:hypothetical protein [Bacteroidales bacterium]
MKALFIILSGLIVIVNSCNDNLYKRFSIVSKKGSVQTENIEKMVVVSRFENNLPQNFINAFENSLIEGFESNNIDLKFVERKVLEPDTVRSCLEGLDDFNQDVVMLVNINSLLKKRPDGASVLAGTKFCVKVIDMKSGGQIWLEQGKVDYIDKLKPKQIISEEMQKEIAFHNSKAIVEIFVSELHQTKPEPVFTTMAERIREGQWVN